MAVVVVAFHRPDHRLARQLVASLLGQEGVAVSVEAVLDGAETAGDAVLRAMLDDPRIRVHHSDAALGVRGAFAFGLAQGLSHFPGEETLFAFADQDDAWYPAKLARSIAKLKDVGASLVHCDAQVIAGDGTVIASSLHGFEDRQNADTLLEALLLNAVSGMTAVFTAPVARLSCRLMDNLACGLLHDHVTAVAAASIGRVAVLRDTLVDYVQHGGNALGARELQFRPWYRRALTARDLAGYRRTSRTIFEERRPLAQALDAAGLLPPDLGRMFLVGDTVPSLGRLVVTYDRALLRLFAAGQIRRGFLCLRVMDGAWQRWRGMTI